jgi:glucokinase
MSSAHWIGVDLGGTKILAGLFDDDLNLIARSKQPTNSESGPAAVVARVAQAVDAVVREGKIDPTQVKGMGLGVPGQVELVTSKVRFAPNLGWSDYDILAAAPPEWAWPLVVENDVQMGTYGEFVAGAAKGARDVFGIFIGTGVGGGFIFNGELYRGFNGHAGEVGNIVLNWRTGNTLESIAGRKFQMRRAKKLLDDSPKRVRKGWKGVEFGKVKSSQLAKMYHDNDSIALRVVDDAARAVGAGIASVVNLLSPEVVVIGGGVAEALGDTFIERVWDFAQRHTLPGAADKMRCVPAALGDDSGIVGCAAFARNKFLTTPAS